jgi:hypothetical protein
VNGLVRLEVNNSMPQASLESGDVYPTSVSTQQFVNLTGLRYAEPRPPGLSTGRPWFLPQCGAGPESLNPADDPEQHR